MEILVVGTGNEIYNDDGIGIYVLKKLQEFTFSRKVTLISIGTDAFSLLNYDLGKYQQIIIVDGICSGGQEGDLYFIPATRLNSGQRPYSIHDITWYEVLEMGGLLEKAYLFGVEINTLKMGEEFSPILREKIDFYAAKLYEKIVEE
ncbi:MAG: hydrogenase maturation protease [Peptococcales bacterium]|jgi:hydrogenase maturation protease